MSKMILARILALVVGYFFGTFQTGYFYGKAHGIDVREHGSGNSGTTNTLRTLGWKAGAVTFFGDLFKAIIAVLIFYFIYRNTYPQAVKCKLRKNGKLCPSTAPKPAYSSMHLTACGYVFLYMK